MKRHRFLLGLCLLASFAFSPALVANDQLVYIGTYTNRKNATVESKGIYVLKFDSEKGTLEKPTLAAEVKNPSFVAIAPSKKFLYSVSEVEGGGAITAFSLDKSTGKLTFLNSQSTQGPGPCHVSLDATGKVAMAANYSGGSIISYPIKDDGSLGESATFVQHDSPSGAYPKRQAKAHAHSVNVDKGNVRAFACDLGCDKVFVYDLDKATGKMTASNPAFASVPAGSGPRHLSFHPNGKFFWVNNEMSMTVTGFEYDEKSGAIKAIETLSTLPEGVAVDPKFSTAETQVHPSGKFVYVSNRTHDTIASYSIDQTSGKLTYIENVPSVVNIPRNFGIDATGKWLITAGQDSSNLAVFSIDQTSGKIKPTGQVLDVGSPVCVKFLPLN